MDKLVSTQKTAISRWNRAWQYVEKSEDDRLMQAMSDLLHDKAPDTQAAYTKDWLDFATFLGSPDDTARAAKAFLSFPVRMANAAVRDYKHALLEHGLSSATVNRRLAVIKKLVTLGRQADLIRWKLDVPQAPRKPKKDSRGPGLDVIVNLLALVDAAATAPEASREAIRNAAVIRMLADLGVRRGALVHFKLKDYDVPTRTVTLRMKGGKLEPFVLPQPTFEAVERWRRIRGNENPESPFFFNVRRASATPTALSGRMIYDIVQSLGKDVNEALKIRPHGIRHTAITAVASRHGMHAAQRFARHQSSKTTEGYFDAAAEMGNTMSKQLTDQYEEAKKDK